KRILIADDYYPALTRPNVEVVTESITRATERGLVTADGVEREFDAILFGTGFEVAKFLSAVNVAGVGGAQLSEAWKGGPSAYLGTTVANFPNLFVLMGPNTGLGHNSMIFMIESQIEYALACMRAAERRGAKWARVLPKTQERFNDQLQPRLARSVWASGWKCWYLDPN